MIAEGTQAHALADLEHECQILKHYQSFRIEKLARR